MPAKTSKPASNAYHAHRERQRRRILSAAENLFEERGIDRTTMAEVISASGIRPSTIYQYFSNKDEIVWAILGDVMEEVAAHARQSVDRATTGLDKITAMLQYMADELADNQPRIRFLAQFDAMYARDWPVERLLTLEAQFHDRGFKAFRSLIRQGIADGSLRPDLDPNLTLHAVMNAVIAAQRRLASLGEKVELEYGQPIDRLFMETIRIIILGLRAEGATSSNVPSGIQSTPAHHSKEVLVKFHLRIMIAICTTLLSLASVPAKAAEKTPPRLVLAADNGWKFTFWAIPAARSHLPLQTPPGAHSTCLMIGASKAAQIRIIPPGPEGDFSPIGIGWYRKTFSAPAAWRGMRVTVEFDGVYRDATVYLNGQKLGNHPYGYTSFTFDLTPDLNFAGPNVLAVRVDNSAQPNSRWYSGSGIYRHVRVIVTGPTHVAHWGVFVTTPEASADSAKVSIQTKVSNDSAKPVDVTVETTLYDHAGNEVGTTKSPLTIAQGKETEVRADDHGRKSISVVPGFAYVIPRCVSDPEIRQTRRPG